MLEEAKKVHDRVWQRMSKIVVPNFALRRAADHCTAKSAEYARKAGEDNAHASVLDSIRRSMIYSLAADMFLKEWKSTAVEMARTPQIDNRPTIN